MTLTLTLAVTGGVMFSVGATLLLRRALTRIVLGVVLLGNAVNLLILASGGPVGDPPLLGPGTGPEDVTDPLPQAMVLTAIVITLAVTAFLLALAHRSWQLTGSDEVRDDIEDRRVALRADEAVERARLQEEYRNLRRQYRRDVRAGGGRYADRDRLAQARADYREARARLRRRIRADRARQARAEDPSGDLWDNVLGEDR